MPQPQELCSRGSVPQFHCSSHCHPLYLVLDHNAWILSRSQLTEYRPQQQQQHKQVLLQPQKLEKGLEKGRPKERQEKAPPHKLSFLKIFIEATGWEDSKGRFWNRGGQC